MFSIIIPIRYRTDLTRVCIDSIIKYTDIPYELILVQEGNDEEITKLLKSYNTKFVQNKEPKGFAGAMNSGLDLTEGDYYVFLNNDTVVIPNWLNEIEKVFQDNTIGLVSPTFTEATPYQSIDMNNGNEVTIVNEEQALKGVCFVVKKEVMDKIGRWDEQFGFGGGEDNDICIRVKRAGYKLAVARKSYIYHYGSASARELYNNDIGKSHTASSKELMKLKEKWKIKKDVMVAIPTLSGQIQVELLNLLNHWAFLKDIRIKVFPIKGVMPLDNAKNLAIKEFLKEPIDYLFFLDDDVIPPVNVIERLVSHDKDIVSGLYYIRNTDDNGMPAPMPLSLRKYPDGYKVFWGEGLEKVDVICDGCCLVKRKVLEKMKPPYHLYIYDEDGRVKKGSEFYFSEKAKEAGFEIYTDCNLICKHYKKIDLNEINQLMAKYIK